jgi:prophage regulatory protein
MDARHERLLRVRAVLDRIGISRTHLYELIRDGRFPQPVSLCGGTAIAWHESTIDEWIAARPPSGPGVSPLSQVRHQRKRQKTAKESQP